MELNPLWTAKDVAHYLQCSSRTVLRLSEAGQIPRPVITYGQKFRRWDPEDVRQHLARRKRRRS